MALTLQHRAVAVVLAVLLAYANADPSAVSQFVSDLSTFTSNVPQNTNISYTLLSITSIQASWVNLTASTYTWSLYSGSQLKNSSSQSQPSVVLGSLQPGRAYTLVVTAGAGRLLLEFTMPTVVVAQHNGSWISSYVWGFQSRQQPCASDVVGLSSRPNTVLDLQQIVAVRGIDFSQPSSGINFLSGGIYLLSEQDAKRAQNVDGLPQCSESLVSDASTSSGGVGLIPIAAAAGGGGLLLILILIIVIRRRRSNKHALASGKKDWDSTVYGSVNPQALQTLKPAAENPYNTLGEKDNDPNMYELVLGAGPESTYDAALGAGGKRSASSKSKEDPAYAEASESNYGTLTLNSTDDGVNENSSSDPAYALASTLPGEASYDVATMSIAEPAYSQASKDQAQPNYAVATNRSGEPAYDFAARNQAEPSYAVATNRSDEPAYDFAARDTVYWDEPTFKAERIRTKRQTRTTELTDLTAAESAM